MQTELQGFFNMIYIHIHITHTDQIMKKHDFKKEIILLIGPQNSSWILEMQTYYTIEK